MALSVGTRLGPYEIGSAIGAGGMGEVYRARDERLDREVAIKVLPSTSFEDPVARSRLLQEARAAAALNHPHICTVHEVGEADGQAYIAMELVDGQALSERLKAGPLPGDMVVRYGLQLADALGHAHERGVVHRDLKSANIMVRSDGRVKVLDFGLAKRLTTTDLSAAVTRDVGSLTQPGTVMGTVAYMAPEQLRGEPARTPSDIWALGVVLQEMTTGKRPFVGQTGFELSASILGKTPTPLPSDTARPLRTVIGRCLEKEAGHRYQTGSEVHAALEAAHEGRPLLDERVSAEAQTVLVSPSEQSEGTAAFSALPPSAPAETISVTLSRRRAIGLGVGVVVALVSGLLTWQLWPDATPRLLAVLPFENVLADEDADYLSDGVAESLIHQVTTLQSVRVTPLSVALNFKGQSVDPRDAGRQLGVDTVLAGALRLEAGRVRITAQLVDVDTGTQLWSNTYDREAYEVLDIQEEIASVVSLKLCK